MTSTPVAEKPAKKPAKQDAFHSYPFWTPRFWHGMPLSVWLGLIARNRFKIHPIRWPMAFLITLISIFNSACGLLQNMFYGRSIDRTEITQTPLFIIGHWRSGTTYLHELMMHDERLSYPTTYECFAPSHSLLTGGIITRWFRFLLPSKRPMDNVLAGWDRPQEDEFALCNLGLGSPYETIAFPNNPPQRQEYLDLKQVSPVAYEKWKSGFRRFMQQITFREPKRLVLKSPPHTARVATILEIFPDARFLHIVRNPYVVYQSTVRLWRSLYDVQGLQLPKFVGLEEFVFDSFDRMYAAFEAARSSVPPGQLYEVRYEDLVADPVGVMQQIYQGCDLGDFASVREKLVAQVSRDKDYKTNRYSLDPELTAAITRRWGDFAKRYGYTPEGTVELPRN